MERRTSRQSLSRGEGVGAILGLAAGDTAGGNHPGGYSSLTQQAVVTAYHLLRHGAIDPSRLAAELSELAGDERDPDVYRSPSPGLRRWLESGEPVTDPDERSGWDPVIRSLPLGLWFRRRPDELIGGAVAVAAVTHPDPVSAVLSSLGAGAVAAGCFGQNGHDLLMALQEVATGTLRGLEAEGRTIDVAAGTIPARLGEAGALIGSPPEAVTGAMGEDRIGQCLAALVLAASPDGDPHRIIESGARPHGSPGGALVGAVVGARSGIRIWPWGFPNDTWFVALGQRLVAGETSLVDLPIPYAVEHRVTFVLDDRTF